jgi:hypothetical protein
MMIICLFVIKHNTIKMYEEVEVLFHTPNGSDSFMHWSLYTHYLWDKVWMGPRAGLGMAVKIKFLPLTGIEPWPPRLQ